MSSMNATPSGERVHIGFFGRRNAGKSSLVNAVTAQKLAVVSDVPGTTTDPVIKSMEILPLGPVVIIDTPGFDDEGSLGELRVEQTRRVIAKSDIAVLVVDSIEGIKDVDAELIWLFKDADIPYVIAFNKSDLCEKEEKILRCTQNDKEICPDNDEESCLENDKESCPQNDKENHPETDKGKGCHPEERSDEGSSDEHNLTSEANPGEPATLLYVSAKTGKGIDDLKNAIAALKPDEKGLPIIRDKINAGDLALLVVPVDEAAPKGRLILPQQQTIRDILDAGASAVVVKDTELEDTLAKLGASARPALVITDSQVFGKVRDIVSDDIMLTSFSILMARHKGLLDEAVRGIATIEKLRDGDKVLIAEGCTHHRQCGDIGSVKIPRWLSDFTGRKLVYETTSGTEYPSDLSEYALVVHCGGCMLNEKEVVHRTREAASQGVPITNYGTVIAHLNGILKRSLEIFPEFSL